MNQQCYYCRIYRAPSIITLCVECEQSTAPCLYCDTRFDVDDLTVDRHGQFACHTCLVRYPKLITRQANRNDIELFLERTMPRFEQPFNISSALTLLEDLP